MDPPVDRYYWKTIKGNSGDAARRRKTKRRLFLIAYAFSAVLVFEAIKHALHVAPGETSTGIRHHQPQRASQLPVSASVAVTTPSLNITSFPMEMAGTAPSLAAKDAEIARLRGEPKAWASQLFAKDKEIARLREESKVLAYQLAAKDNKIARLGKVHAANAGLNTSNHRASYREAALSSKSFPPGCNWTCYFDRNPKLLKHLDRTEEAAISHYVAHGISEGRRCSCDQKHPSSMTLSNVASNAGNNAFVPMHGSLQPSPRCLVRQDEISDWCKARHKKRACQNHRRESLSMHTQASNNKHKRCGKVLWFAAMSEGSKSHCKQDGLGGYKREYAAALLSARRNAAETLQPVLLLGRYGLANENSTDLSALGKWAKYEHGAIVITLSRISFQDMLDPDVILDADLMGTWLRLDIPDIIQRHNLLNLTSIGGAICPGYVLYTDSDVIFPNPITYDDLDMLGELVSTSSDAFVSYGREFSTNENQIVNAGVMVIDIKRFAEEWPHILNYGRSQGERGNFPINDQVWLNEYFGQNNITRSMRKMLPIHWNWKVYWRLEPSRWTDVKVVHFHGPKPGKGLAEIAQCNLHADKWASVPRQTKKEYTNLIQEGICCDTGKTAAKAWEFYKDIQDSIAAHHICP